jgi:hypothetical protein
MYNPVSVVGSGVNKVSNYLFDDSILSVSSLSDNLIG